VSYRSELCAFCDETAAEYCPRCRVAVCVTHRRAPDPFCAMCTKERDDDLETARFLQAVYDEPDQGGSTAQQRAAVNLVGAIGRAFQRLTSRRTPAQRKFDERTPADIADWRKAAGIRVRGTS
jgi:hypothetical protein